MGIEGVEYLSGHDPEEFHVIIVGRAGGHPGTGIYLFGPGPKRLAIDAGQEKFRRENKLPKNIQLVSHCVFSGDESMGETFVTNLMDEMEKDKAVNSNIFSTGEKLPGEG
jgi:hypothetical protein